MEVLVNIYVLKCPITNDIRYIGRTKNALNIRLNGHIAKAKNQCNNKSHKNNWIRFLLAKQQRPKIELISIVSGWTNSHIYEQTLIQEYILQGFDLVNSDDRGEGSVNKIISEKQKKLISSTLKKRYKEGLKVATAIPLFVFDLEGAFIKEFESISACAKWLKVSNKNLENSLRRNSKRFHKFQIKKTNQLPGKYINPRCKYRLPD